MMIDFWKNQQILVTGGSGFLGSHLVQELLSNGVKQEQIFVPRKAEFDLRQKAVCEKVVKDKSLVFHLAGNVGGIGYNHEHMADMFYDNLMMGVSLMKAAYEAGVKKFIGVGTICSYPKNPPIPFKEEDLWNGYPEEITGPYGLVKKMLLVQGQIYNKIDGFNAIYLLPTNLYGPRDKSTHVIAQLIDKFGQAKLHNLPEVTVWGSGRATRDFLYIKDAASALVMAAAKYNNPAPINLGSGQEVPIAEIVNLIAELMDYKGAIVWDKTKPDGQPRRLLDVSKAKQAFDFSATTTLKEGLQKTIDWYLRVMSFPPRTGTQG